jgi:hypothetical protein
MEQRSAGSSCLKTVTAARQCSDCKLGSYFFTVPNTVWLFGKATAKWQHDKALSKNNGSSDFPVGKK